MAELRRDPVTGSLVIIAPERDDRPHPLDAAEPCATAAPCPFCTGNEILTPPEVWADREAGSHPDTPGWRVRVVPNKYPAVEQDPESSTRQNSFYEIDAAVGVQEVIIESPRHEVHMSGLGARQCAAVLRAYRARWQELETDGRWRYLLIYKNQGERAGATLEHVHSQLIALPEVPPRAAREWDRARARLELGGRCISCEVVERELQESARLVLESERFVALCPFAARFAFEIWILPKSHAAHFAASSDAEIAELAVIVRRAIQKLSSLAVRVPFNLLIHSGTLREAAGQFCHWRMEILPQLHRAAGFEWGSGMHMNPVAPEQAARLLRDTPG